MFTLGGDFKKLIQAELHLHEVVSTRLVKAERFLHP